MKGQIFLRGVRPQPQTPVRTHTRQPLHIVAPQSPEDYCRSTYRTRLDQDLAKVNEVFRLFVLFLFSVTRCQM